MTLKMWHTDAFCNEDCAAPTNRTANHDIIQGHFLQGFSPTRESWDEYRQCRNPVMMLLFSPRPSKMFFCVINTLKMMILINIWWQGKKERLRCGDVAISEDQIPRSKSLLIHIILRKTWKHNLDRGKHQYFCSYLLSTFPPHEAVGPCLGILGVGKLDSLSSRNKASLQHASSSTIRNEIHGRLQSNWADTS